jgi:hypothetical protein
MSPTSSNAGNLRKKTKSIKQKSNQEDAPEVYQTAYNGGENK